MPDQRAIAGLIATPNWNYLRVEVASVPRGRRLLMAREGKAILRFARNPLRLRQELGSDAHHQGSFARASKKLRVEVDARIDRDMMHVLETTDDLHVFSIG